MNGVHLAVSQARGRFSAWFGSCRRTLSVLRRRTPPLTPCVGPLSLDGTDFTRRRQDRKPGDGIASRRAEQFAFGSRRRFRIFKHYDYVLLFDNPTNRLNLEDGN